MKKYTLAALQMAYFGALTKDEEGEKCVLCWNVSCGCDSKSTAKSDPFLNLTTISEFQNENLTLVLGK